MEIMCQNGYWELGRKYPKYPKIYVADLPIWAKSFGYC